MRTTWTPKDKGSGKKKGKGKGKGRGKGNLKDVDKNLVLILTTMIKSLLQVKQQ